MNPELNTPSLAPSSTGLAAADSTTFAPPIALAGQLRRNKVFEGLFGRATAPLRIGRFTVLDCIGRGGMGELYTAYDPQLDRQVAIKLVRPDKRGGRDAEIRLQREAQSAARVSHPNVVQVYEAGSWEGRVFMAMEFVRGQTLRQWAAAKGESTSAPALTRAILERFIAAGHGLAAIHEAGLAHRDFKPANVLIGEDERVRIVDFGLARNVLDHGAESARTLSLEREAVLDSGVGALGTLTVPGTIMGTPRYMAPEQWRGERGDALSDQFSFCVALYEALFGEVPFRADDTDELLAAIAAGRVEPGERGVKLPRPLRAAIMRGLADAPDQRWPSMDALLNELERALQTTRRSWFVLAGALALGLALGLGALALDDDPRCEFDDSALAGTWDAQRRTQLEAALEATGHDTAKLQAATVAVALDSWSSNWVEGRRQACAATWVEGVQSEQLLDRRQACFDRKRRAFGATVDLLTEVEFVGRADELLAELPSLGECSNARALDARTPMPTRPEAVARVLSAHESLARATLLHRVGRATEAIALAEAALADADELDYLPLRVEAELSLAELSVYTETTGGLSSLREVANHAETLGLLELEASSRVMLARHAAGDLSEPALELWLIDDAEQLLARLDQRHDPRVLELLAARALIRENAGDYAGAAELLEQGLELARAQGLEGSRTSLRENLANIDRQRGNYTRARVTYLELIEEQRSRWGPQHRSLAELYYNLGVLELDRGEFDAARAVLDSSRALHVLHTGVGSFALAQVDFALAKLALSTGDFDHARQQIEAVLPIYVAERGPEHQSTARAHAALGIVQFYTGDLDGSLASYRRALPIFERVLGPDNDEVGLMHSNIGESLLGLGRLDEAVAAFDHALELLERVLPPTHPYLGVPLKARGLALLETGHPHEALADLDRAVILLETEGDEPIELADARFGLARALRADPQADQSAKPRADELTLAAIEALTTLGLDDRVADIESWRTAAEP